MPLQVHNSWAVAFPLPLCSFQGAEESTRPRPRPGGRLPDDALILRCVRAADAHLGIRSNLDCASTDANIPLSMGLAAVSIGAGGHGGGAHTPQEWFHPEGRELGLKRILLTLALLLGDLDAGAGPGGSVGAASRNGG